MTQVMNASDVRQQWSKVLNKVFNTQTKIIVEKSGIPVAAVISAQELQRFSQMEKARNERFKALDKMRQAFRGIPSEKINQEVAKAITQVRITKRSKSKS